MKPVLESQMVETQLLSSRRVFDAVQRLVVEQVHVRVSQVDILERPEVSANAGLLEEMARLRHENSQSHLLAHA